jgi:Flp pilus assembly protein TadD
MMNKAVLKFAISGLALAVTMVGCKPAATGGHVASASSAVPRGNAKAMVSQAQAAAQRGDLAGAVMLAERAVELSPQDVGYRMMLGESYLRSGRFHSAAAAFADVLSLDPSNIRAGLSLALADVALGDNRAAVAQLDSLGGDSHAADRGLAYALAGQAQRAVALLEPAARDGHADGRVRQNLAFAYALAGNWEKARVVAAQDISPADLGPRLEQWAALAQSDNGQLRIASLLRITPAEDPGQPERLALVPTRGDTALAAADPAPAAPQPAPVQLASSDAPAWVSARTADASAPVAPAPAEEQARPLYADAVQTLVTPQATLVQHSPVRSTPAVDRSFQASPHAAAQGRFTTPGRFAVQLGAFSTASGVERAWASLYKRYGFSDHTPLSTRVSIPGKGTFHRLSVAGFANRDEAVRVCGAVRSRGGVCFVRAVAGDAPTQWASRYATRAG